MIASLVRRLSAARAPAWVALALVTACARVPPQDLSRSPSDLLAQVRTAQARVQRVKGTARVRVDAPGLSGSVLEFMAAEKPDRVRLETLDFFGNQAALLVAEGGHFAFFDARANVFYRGDATPENVSRLLPIVIPVEELVTILCGSAPLMEGRALTVVPEGDRLLLTLGQGDLGQRLAIGSEAVVAWSRVRRAVRVAGESDTPAYDLAFSDFGRRAGLRFPKALVLDAPAGKSHIELSWRADLEVNPAVEPSLFHLDPPRGARVVELAHGAPIPPEPVGK